MEKIYLAILLAFIPFINFFLKYLFSYRAGELGLFKKHVITYYFDWVFVPFNFLWVYTFNLPFIYLICFALLSLIFFSVLIFLWIDLHKKENRPVYMFDIKSGKIRSAGLVELFFFVFEAVLIFSFLFSSIVDTFVYFEIFILFVFLLLSLFSSFRIHGKINSFDLFIVILGFLVLFGKMFFWG